jgi:hypothetical protein
MRTAVVSPDQREQYTALHAAHNRDALPDAMGLLAMKPPDTALYLHNLMSFGFSFNQYSTLCCLKLCLQAV